MKRRITASLCTLVLVATLPLFGDVVAQLCHLLTGNLTFDPAAGAVANPTTVTPHITPSGCESYIHHRTADANVVVGDPTGTYEVTGAVTLYAKSINCPGYADKSGSAAYTISGGAGAAPAYVQISDAASCGSQSGCTATLPGNNAIGGTIVAFIDYDAAVGAPNVTKGSDTGAICGTTTSANGLKSAIYIIKNAQQASTFVGITFSPTNPSFSDIMAIEYSGADTTTPCDATGSSANSSNTLTSLTPGSATATNNYTMLVNFCSTQSSGGPWGMTSTWTTRHDTGGTLIEDKAVTSKAAQNPEITSTVGGKFWNCQQAAIVGASQ